MVGGFDNAIYVFPQVFRIAENVPVVVCLTGGLLLSMLLLAYERRKYNRHLLSYRKMTQEVEKVLSTLDNHFQITLEVSVDYVKSEFKALKDLLTKRGEGSDTIKGISRLEESYLLSCETLMGRDQSYFHTHILRLWKNFKANELDSLLRM